MANGQHRFERILLTNDDGIDAPGLKVLERIASQLANEVWVVAPLLDQSGTSHSLSLHAPLRLSYHGTRRFAVTGTPGDCIAVALGYLLNHDKPDLILSGVNRGANLGTETVFSGTVGAAMTGLLFGIPSIALSQAFTDRIAVPWGNALKHGAPVIEQLMAMEWAQDVCLNVNFPSCAPTAVLPLKITRQGRGAWRGCPCALKMTRAVWNTIGFNWRGIKGRMSLGRKRLKISQGTSPQRLCSSSIHMRRRA